MSKQSLLSKIASKQVLTPLEIINIQFLDRKHLEESNPDTNRWSNPYLAVEHVPPLISSQEFKKLLYISEPRKQKAYDYYQWLGNMLIALDNMSREVGNRGIALLDELKYCQSERVVQFLLQEEVPMSDLSLEKFTIYSHVHNRQMKYLALIESFGKTFRDLIVITNNVLTANLDLEEIVEVDELNCLQYLRQWFERGDISTEEGESVELNVAQLCFDNVFHTIIDQNHPNFVELLQTKVELAEYVLFPNFKNDSMIYVKKVIEEKIKNQIVL